MALPLVIIVQDATRPAIRVDFTMDGSLDNQTGIISPLNSTYF
jgi:hypothetical protein